MCTTALQASIKVVNLGNATNERVRAFALIIRTLCEQLIEYDATFGEAKDEQRCAGRCALASTILGKAAVVVALCNGDASLPAEYAASRSASSRVAAFCSDPSYREVGSPEAVREKGSSHHRGEWLTFCSKLRLDHKQSSTGINPSLRLETLQRAKKSARVWVFTCCSG